jgi:PiT family inorganic phosphate transporter
VRNYLRTRRYDPNVVPGLAVLARDIKTQVEQYGSFRRLPTEAVQNVRNDMYLAAEAIRRISKDSSYTFNKADRDLLVVYRSELDGATRFIPIWVKVPSRLRLAWGRWWGGSASWSRSARRLGKVI